MGRSAPDDEVRDAAHRVLSRHRTVVSQRRFAKLVSDELGSTSVTPRRLRRLVARAPFCRLEYRSRPGEKQKPLHSCPICGGALSKGRNQTLFGGEVTLVLRCGSCKYWTGRNKQVPTLYSFHLEGPSQEGVAGPELRSRSD